MDVIVNVGVGVTVGLGVGVVVVVGVGSGVILKVGVGVGVTSETSITVTVLLSCKYTMSPSGSPESADINSVGTVNVIVFPEIPSNTLSLPTVPPKSSHIGIDKSTRLVQNSNDLSPISVKLDKVTADNELQLVNIYPPGTPNWYEKNDSIDGKLIFVRELQYDIKYSPALFSDIRFKLVNDVQLSNKYAPPTTNEGKLTFDKTGLYPNDPSDTTFSAGKSIVVILSE